MYFCRAEYYFYAILFFEHLSINLLNHFIMKKLMILLAVACLVFISCGTRTEKVTDADETVCVLTPEQLENWANWDKLDEEAQVVLIGEMKVYLDECKAKCEAKCKEAKEGDEEVIVDPEKEAKCAEFKAKWDAFDTLTLEEQKAMIDQVLEHKEKCCKAKEVCQEEEEVPDAE